MADDDDAAPIRPLLRQRVHVRAGTWATSMPSVVEDLLETDLVVAGPLDLVEDQVPETGARITVAWEDANGPQILPCELGSVLVRELPQWQVRPAGPARSEQRRRHVRVAAEDAVTIIRDREALGATLLDLSEGGMRFVLEDADTFVGCGDLLSAVLRFEGTEHDMRSRVVRVHVVPGHPRTVAAAFLDLSHHQADDLRRHVFAEQTRARARTIT